MQTFCGEPFITLVTFKGRTYNIYKSLNSFAFELTSMPSNPNPLHDANLAFNGVVSFYTDNRMRWTCHRFNFR